MKNYMTSIIGLATLLVASNTAPAQLAQAGSAPNDDAPALKPVPKRAPRANTLAGTQIDRAEEFEVAQSAAGKALVDHNPWLIERPDRSSSESLVIPKESSDAKTLEECEEDLNVMARI